MTRAVYRQMAGGENHDYVASNHKPCLLPVTSFRQTAVVRQKQCKQCSDDIWERSLIHNRLMNWLTASKVAQYEDDGRSDMDTHPQSHQWDSPV